MELGSITDAYRKYGVEDFYKQKGREYSNPHYGKIKELVMNSVDLGELVDKSILDLACGSGEMTKLLPLDCNVEGIDPYTYELYTSETGRACHKMNFVDIIKNGLPGKYDVVFCSFAMHLAKVSQLPVLANRLSLDVSKLIVITPHKRPNIKEEYGWKLEEEEIYERVRLRKYASLNKR